MGDWYDRIRHLKLLLDTFVLGGTTRRGVAYAPLSASRFFFDASDEDILAISKRENRGGNRISANHGE